VKITVVTSNPNKATEVAAFFGDEVEVTHVALECPEYRDDDVGEIARQKAAFAFEKVGSPVIVDDTGFYISHLNGFPGPYAAYVLDTIGLEGILNLMGGATDRTGYFETAIAYADETGITIFRGRVEGVIVSPRGSDGFGYDPIFEVNGRTFAEYPLNEKAAVSHRGRALAAFRDFITSQTHNENC